MSSASLTLSLSADLDAARKLSVASSTSSGISFTQRRPFTPIDIQGSPTVARRADSDRLIESSLYAVYAMETFTFGTTSPAAGSSKQSPPQTPEATGSSGSQPSSPRSHASHFFPNASSGDGSTTVAAMTRTPLPLIAQTNHPPSPRSSNEPDSSVTSPSSMFTHSIRNSTHSNVTTPSQFSFDDVDDQWTDEGGGSEDDISIGSTRYEDGSSMSSRRRRRSSGWGVETDDGRHVPPILEDETEFGDMHSERRMSAPDLVPPPPRSDSLRPTLEIETTALSENNLDDEPTTAKPPYTPAFHFPTRLMATPSSDTPPDYEPPAAAPAPEEDLESDWIEKLRGGIVTFDIDDNERNLNYHISHPTPSIPDPTPPADETASSPTLRSPNTGRRLSFFSLFGRRERPNADNMTTATAITISGPDTFETHAQQYHHSSNNANWVFRRSFADEKKAERRRDNNHLSSRENRERVRKTEVWTVPGIKGIFLLKRIFSDPPSTYQLAVQHLPPKSTRSSSEKAPVLLVHRHSRVQGFSLGWVRKDGSSLSPVQHPSDRGDPDAKQRKHHTLHLLATRTVQQSYTSTVSWRKLEDYGLLTSPVDNQPVVVGMSSGSSSGSSERTHRSRASMSSRAHGSNEQIPPLPRRKPPSPTPSETSILTDEDLDSILGVTKKRKTSHFAAFGTISASDIHRFRGNELISAAKDDNVVRKVLWSHTKEPVAEKKKKIKSSRSAPAYLETPRQLESPINTPQPSSPQEPKSIPSSFTPYVPPWLTFNENALTHNLTKADEEKRRRLENLGRNFKDVGLLASAASRSDNRLGPSQLSRKTRSMIAAVTEPWTNVFDGIPEEALFMLLPLWIGATEGKRFLLIWYKAWDPPSSTDLPSTTGGASTSSFSKFKAIYSTKARQEEKDRERRQTISTDTVKSTRSTKSTTSTATTRGGRRSQIEPSETRPFLVNARPVSLADIQGTDIRVPQCGLQGISVPVEDDGSGFTPGGELLADYILARCPASTQPPPGDEDARRMDTVGGVEFDETCLLRLGLAYETSTANGERPSTDSKSFRDLRLTPVGRSIVELAWIGALALREFQTI